MVGNCCDTNPKNIITQGNFGIQKGWNNIKYSDPKGSHYILKSNYDTASKTRGYHKKFNNTGSPVKLGMTIQTGQPE